MKDSQNIEELRTLVSQALRQVSEFEETGLNTAEDAGLRLVDINQEEMNYVIKIASDGLNLNHKLALETHLKEALHGRDVDLASCVFYFKRLQVAPKTPISSPQTPGGGVVGPFGIKQNKRAIPGVKRVVAIASGKGGVGKSTVSVNLAVALAQHGQKVGLLDADIYGPSAPLMLGLEGSMAVSADRQMIPRESYGVKCVSFGFMSDPQNPVIWRGPMVSKALQQLFYEAAWGDLDYLLIDLPPGTGDVQLTMIEKLPLFGGIIVSTPQNVALLDAHKGVTMFRRLNVPILGIVENMSYHICGNCGHEEAIFGDHLKSFSEKEKITVLGQIPLQADIRAGADEGQPMARGEGPVAQIFSQLAQRLIENS
ncbi:MAG: Mrp/NBP35 family ATP-binding protein [Oligoflexus sp.]